MAERNDVAVFKGNPVTLVGDAISVGSDAPNPNVLKGFDDTKLHDLLGDKATVISVVPSLDTGVCDAQTRKFNELVGELGGAKVVTVSVDLPPAQARWCGAAGVEDVEVVSDFRDREFGNAFGVYIKELGLLARSIFVVDGSKKVTYAQIVPEVTDHVDYDAAVAAAKALTQ